ncbi:MAG: AAA family ATPase [Candidatus Aenigmarchaeota archaeon]|nr:AAA family ATPase [Candidatus Aenigmarchaeota archaeon]
MIVNSVRLRNFKSHHDTAIGFGTGINVILGENGAGKTSVLEAISFALFKEYEGNLDDLVMRGQGSMAVELVFTSHGRTYKVVRMRKKASSDSNLYLLEDGEKLLQSGDSEVDKEIARILGIDKYLFINAVYVRQGEIARLLVARPAEKKQLITRLLGIDSLERVWERMRVVIDAYRDRKSRLEAQILDEDRIREQLDGIDSELDDVKKRAAKTAMKISDASKSLKVAEEEESGLEEMERKYAELASALGSAEESLEREREGLQSLRRQGEGIREAERKLQALGKRIGTGRQQRLGKELLAKRKRADEINEGIGKLRGKMDEMRDLESSLERAGSRCPLCGSELTREHRNGLVKERRGKIETARHDIAELEAELSRVAAGIEAAEGRRSELAALEKEESELKGIVKRRVELDAALEKSGMFVKELEKKAESLGSQLGEIEGKRKMYQKVRERVRELRSELSALREASGRQHGKRQELENSRGRLREEIKSIEGKKKEHDALSSFVKLLGDIRGLFDKSGLQKDLRMKSGPIIESHMREFFREFNFDYSDMSLDENYDITLYGPTGESTTGMMSGGERIAAALAMRLGIARTLVGGSAESMFLDEPTVFLDTQRRQDLIDVLKKLSVMPQLIIVTHDSSMEEAADKITVISKERGVSSAEP